MEAFAYPWSDDRSSLMATLHHRAAALIEKAGYTADHPVVVGFSTVERRPSF
jgi:hypothetical protein